MEALIPSVAGRTFGVYGIVLYQKLDIGRIVGILYVRYT